MKSKPSITFVSLVLASFSSIAYANELRPLAADRPDATESPQTVDKGHWQIETSILGFARDKQNGVTSKTYEAFNTNLKYGVTDSVDVHWVMTPYVKEKVESDVISRSQTSHSDLEVRSKINLWGNEGGETSMALLPYIKIPSGDFSNDKTEGGLIVTYGAELFGFGAGLQAQVDYLYDASKDKRAFAGSHTAVIGYDIVGNTSGYAEYIGEWGLNDDYIPYASFGLTQQTSADQQWDIGSKVALNDDGQDFEIFFGVTQRY